REWSPALAAKKSHLFTPTSAVRWRKFGTAVAPFDRSAGENPPSGAVITYYLADKPKKKITLEILDATGKRVTLLESKEEKKKKEGEEVTEGDDADDEDMGDYEAPEKKKKPIPAEKGFNRYGWDLKYKGATKIPKAKVDAGNPEDGPLALPGEYTLKL